MKNFHSDEAGTHEVTAVLFMLAPWLQQWQVSLKGCLLVGPPLWPRLKNRIIIIALSIHWMDYLEICFRYSWSPQDEAF